MDAAVDFISGVAGGTASVYVGQPLDTIKVKMQMFPDLYRNAFKCGLETFQKDGIARGLYAGTVPALTANIAGNLIYFVFYSGFIIAYLNQFSKRTPSYSCLMVFVRKLFAACHLKRILTSLIHFKTH